ncbi:MAG: hypothetical protein H6754_01090 [Candidatus Omnitrophica bacterium]|nr:hypothetical protein [Candidatus Omnitrophota bacterium]
MRVFKIVAITFLACFLFFQQSVCAQPNVETFVEFCASSYEKTAKCPNVICDLRCFGESGDMICPPTPEVGAKNGEFFVSCQPKACNSLKLQDCPKEFCSVMTDCSNKETCQPKTPDVSIPTCGALAYSGQDVECCQGLVKRCGFDYLDGSCNMEGKNTAYRFPICIACGDGFCTNFENHCNCPEDCKKTIFKL